MKQNIFSVDHCDEVPSENSSMLRKKKSILISNGNKKMKHFSFNGLQSHEQDSKLRNANSLAVPVVSSQFLSKILSFQQNIQIKKFTVLPINAAFIP